MILELRTYVPVKGREQALAHRFRDSTLAMFRRQKIHVVDFWIAEDGEIGYLVGWEDPDHMKLGWDRFRDDPEWLDVKRSTEADGPLVEKIISKVVARPAFFDPTMPSDCVRFPQRLS